MIYSSYTANSLRGCSIDFDTSVTAYSQAAGATYSGSIGGCSWGQDASYMARMINATAIAEYMYPFVIAGMYTNLLIRSGNTLTTDQGMDERLIDMAHEREMEVLDVESAELQMGLDAQYSDNLHHYLVQEALAFDRNAYLDEISNLYELWCSGDEAALIAYLQEEDVSNGELSEDALDAKEEYENLLLKNRDAGMLEKAEEYLASGKTVFFAVGLAHLLGETGLVDALREAGYTVTLVEYAQ